MQEHSFELSPSQLFFSNTSDSNRDTVCHVSFRVYGLDIVKFEKCLNGIIADEDSFKMSIRHIVDGGRPVQVLREDPTFWLALNIKGDNSQNEGNGDLNKWSNNFKVVIESCEDESIVAFSGKSIFFDFWSMISIFDRTMRIYHGNKIEKSPVGFLQFSEWKNQLIESEGGIESSKYWKEKIEESRRFKNNLSSSHAIVELNRSFVKDFGSELCHLKSVFSIEDEARLVAGFYLMTWALSGSLDDGSGSIGYIYNGRPFDQLNLAVGSFSTHLPFQLNDLNPEVPVSTFLLDITREMGDIGKHREYLNISDMFRRFSDSNLDYQLEFLDFDKFLICDDIDIHDVSLDNSTGKIRFQIHKKGNRLQLFVLYSSFSFFVEEIEYMVDLWQNYVEKFQEANAELTIREFIQRFSTKHLSASPTCESKQNVEYSVVDLFDLSARENSNKIAVVDGFNSYTYTDLERKSAIISLILSENGVVAGDRVGIMLDPGVDLVAATLGILRSGATFVPIDVNDAWSRIDHIVSDSGIGCLISCNNYQAILSRLQVTAVCIDWEDFQSMQIVTPNGRNIRQPHDIAYVIYTSGTTGKPKGVCIRDSSLINYVCWLQAEHRVGVSDSSILLSSFAFDLGYTAFWGTLLLGGTMHFVQRDVIYDTDYIVQYLVENKITFIKMTPSYLHVLLSSPSIENLKHSHLRMMILGGEKINVDNIRFEYFPPEFEIINHYGPTETTIGAITHRITANTLKSYVDRPVIGKPIRNAYALIMDANFVALPVGMYGEIFLGGPGLALGYLNQESLTRERFIEHPKYGRVYRTGDLGIQYLNGDILFIGRRDGQVKIRGYRVELDEIRVAIESLSFVKRGLVYARESEVGIEVVSFIVLDGSEEASGVREKLSNFLPEYMIPSHIISIDSIPLTANNKVDFHLLNTLVDNGDRGKDLKGSDEDSAILRIWREILQITDLGWDDNFFMSGGHSLKAIQLLNRVHKETGVKLALKQIYESPTPRMFSLLIASNDSSHYESILPVPKADRYAVSNSQKRMWLSSLRKENRSLFNVALKYQIDGVLDKEILKRAFRALIDRHETLRTNFKFVDDDVYQFILPIESVKFEVNVLRHIDDIESCILEESLRPFNLESDLPIRVSVLETGNSKAVLLLTLHHIISDGWSREILYDEIVLSYNSIYSGEKLDLPPLRIQYKDYVNWSNNNIKIHETYWQRFFEEEFVPLEFPLDYPRPNKLTHNSSTVDTAIFDVGYTKLKSTVAAMDLKMADYFSCIFGLLLGEQVEQNEFVTGAVTSGRIHSDLERMIGIFINYLPIKFKIDWRWTLAEYITKQSRSLTEFYEHEIYPFDLMVEKFVRNSNFARNPVFDTMIIFHNEEDVVFKPQLAGGAVISEFGNPFEVSDKAMLDFKFDIFFRQERILIVMEYNTNLFSAHTANMMLGRFEKLLTEANERSDARLSEFCNKGNARNNFELII